MQRTQYLGRSRVLGSCDILVSELLEQSLVNQGAHTGVHSKATPLT